MIRCSTCFRAFAAALGTAMFACPLAFAQTKTAPAEPAKKPLEIDQLSRSDEHMLLVRLLVYLHSDTYPPGMESEPEDKLPSSGEIKTFIEGRRKLISSISVRLRDLKASPDLIAMYDDYRSILDLADKYGDAVRKHEAEYFEGIKKIRERALVNAQIRNLIGTANVISYNGAVYAGSVGRWAWWHPTSYRRGLLAGAVLSGANFLAASNLIAAQLRLQADLLRILQKEKDAIDRYEKKNLPILYSNIRSEEAKFNREIDSKRPELVKKDKGYLASLVAEYHWKDYEVVFDPFAGNVMGDEKNPFVPLTKLSRSRKIENTKHSDDLAATAKSLLALTEFMPASGSKDGSKVYTRIKADTAFLAGMHANRAAEYQLADAGFRSCIKSPLPAGETARKAFEVYKDLYIDKDNMFPKAIVLQQRALADAYAGFPQAAYDKINLVMKDDLKAIHDPQFYFDSARLRCLNDRDNQNVPVAMAYLNTAFIMGYRNTEKAEVSSDLKILRETRKAEFENAIKTFK